MSIAEKVRKELLRSRGVWDQIAALCEHKNLSNTTMSVKSVAREIGMHFQILRKNLTMNMVNSHPWITYDSEKDVVEISDRP